ncbi:MAG: flagellar protein FliS [Clostridiales bacterium]|jgi:flagellar protein FliS|nr:flagellar protein FliS [Clostridiales bacterium]
MTQQDKEAYVLRVSSASPVQLVVICYELAIAALDEALSAYGGRGFAQSLDKARNCLAELRGTLRVTNSIAKDLFILYNYMERILIAAQYSNDTAPVIEARGLLRKLLEAWNAVSAQNGDPAAMDGSQVVYAGLTYSNGKLDEYVVDKRQKSYEA